MKERKYLLLLTLGALGVVYGDIGTSPLYAMRECFSEHSGVPLTDENVFGVLSLIIWSLVLIISLKYLFFVMRADNRGEGGVLALMALSQVQRTEGDRRKNYIKMLLGIFGASLLYGDGIITPAISVLGAIEGLKVATPYFSSWVVPISAGILVGLFSIQHKGTGSIGRVFGPIILLWFAVLALLGIASVLQYPGIVAALNPIYGLRMLVHVGWRGFLVLSSVFLVVTGAEALYADMGHFGKEPIRLGWFLVAFPGLLLNYMGQGALLIREPEAVANPFYRLAPSWGVIPLVVLATAATVIASQALISGAFSLTRQAVMLGYFPRLKISHTSSKQMGQIYVPFVNISLLVGTLSLVLIFESSSGLASAYGVAVSTTMVITTLLLYSVARRLWGWHFLSVAVLTALMLIVDLSFFAANISKIAQGGYIPLGIGVAMLTLMLTWRRGRQILAERVSTLTPPLKEFLEKVSVDSTIRIPGTAIFMTRNIQPTPPALTQNVKHNKILHKTVVFLRVVVEEEPVVPESDRISVEDLGSGFFRVCFRHGFMESVNVPELLPKCREYGIAADLRDATFFFGRESLIAANTSGMARWRERLFTVMIRNSQRAMIFYNIPAERVIEIGFQIEL